MKKGIILHAVLIVSVLSCNAFGQTSKDAVMALESLQIKCATGISYKDYSQALNKVKVSVNLYLDSADSKNTPNLSGALHMAMKHYDNAQRVWDARYSGGDEVYNHVCDVFSPTLFERITKNYPDIKLTKNSLIFTSIPCFDIDEARLLIWSNAAIEVKKASGLLMHPDLEQKTEPGEKKADTGQAQIAPPNMQQKLEDMNKENERLKKENENLKKLLEKSEDKSD